MNRRTWKTIGPACLAAALAAAAVWAAVRSLQAPPDGPRSVVWDKQTCQECGMSVSDPRFAAQFHSPDGRVLYFDDPGCLFLYVLKRGTDEGRAYFRSTTSDEWLAREDCAFVAADDSPMDFGWGAAPKGTAGAVGWDEAVARFLAEHGDRLPGKGAP